MRRLLLCLLTCTLAATGIAAPLSPAARSEIDSLMSRLEASGCEFNRGGTWHTAVDARVLVQRKLKYLEDRGRVQSTEQFIDLAASGSSTTGQPYLVRCGNDAPVQSGPWLRSRLLAMRATAPARSAP